MWFECSCCEQILPLYFIDSDSAKYEPMEDWICFDCAWDMKMEHHEDGEPFEWDDDEEED